MKTSFQWSILILLLTLTVACSEDDLTPISSDDEMGEVPSSEGNCSGAILPITEGGLPSGFDENNLTIESIQMPFPTLVFAIDEDEVYVIGGQPLGLDLYVNTILTGNPGQPDPNYISQFTPYVTRVNPTTLDTISATLSGGSGLPYLGGLAKHPNGYLYAVAQARIFKINPDDMSIVQSVDMPLPDAQTIYNGVNISSNGRLITKSTALSSFEQGQIFMLDENTLETISELEIQAGSPRLTFDCDTDGNEYIYHLNQDFTFRMIIKDDNIIIDETWQAAYDPYGDGFKTEPTSPRIFGNKVVYTTNTTFSSTRAMKLFFQDTDRTYSLENDTLDGFFMFSDTNTAGWDFNGLSVSSSTGIFIGLDQANGRIAAYSIDDNDQLQYLWEREYGISGRPFIAENTGMVYINDFNPEEGSDYLVVLDLFSGTELGRINTPGTTPSIASAAIGKNNDFYYCSNELGESLGFFHRVSLDQ